MVCKNCMSMTKKDNKSRKQEILIIHDKISEHDSELGRHCGRVAMLSKKVALAIGSKDAELVYCAALIHDVGKLFINPRVIGKPEELSGEERIFVDMHSVMGYSFLKSKGFAKEICNMVLLHHGYHKEKFGFTDIPSHCTGADIIRACDVFDAITTDRPYHKAKSKEEAFAIIKGQREPIPDRIIAEVVKNV